MKKQKIHLVSIYGLITPCGLLAAEFTNVEGTLNFKKVTCQKCKATHWFKNEKSKGIKK